MGSKRIVAAALVVVAALPFATGTAAAASDPVLGYRVGDKGVTILNIVPPGQGRYLTPAEFFEFQASGRQPAANTNQLAMYEDLIRGEPTLAPADLLTYFKDASFGVKPQDVGRRYEPRDGVVVVRDKTFDVPHVYGETRANVMFGAGYVTGEDRLFMMDVLRHVGRGRISEFLGASDANLEMDRATYKTTGYSEAELQAMLDRGKKIHPRLGRIALADVNAYVEGVNAYIDEAIARNKLPAEYYALQQVPRDWKATDTVATAALIGGVFGGGGGQELANARFLRALMNSGYAFAEAREILADFMRSNDPEAVTTIDETYPYMTGRDVDRRSIALPDDAGSGSASEAPDRIDGPFGPIPLRFPTAASNALLVGADQSESGRPLAVFGPQVGYWSPEILFEMELSGPGIHTRGVGFPGIALYTLLGRGDGYAYSATSATGDVIDIFAERICEPDGSHPTVDSDHYVNNRGKCVPIFSRTDTWVAKPSGGGIPSPNKDAVVVSMTTERTDDGIVQERGTVRGKPVAFVRRRTSFKAEVDSALAYVIASDPRRMNGARDFHRAFSYYNFTFNWFYVDGKSIAYELTGHYPRRPKGVDPALPTWGTDPWRWRPGRLSQSEIPETTDPAKGYIMSWNNKQAPRWSASDDNWSYSPVHRGDLLDVRLRRGTAGGRKMDLAEVVKAMADAGTVDLRGERVLPYMLRVVEGPPGLGRPAVFTEIDMGVLLLKKWHRAGVHRRDLNANGEYEHQAAVALMDEWWERALRAVFRPKLKGAYDDMWHDHDDEPGPVGSAYYGGLYGQLQKALRMSLGRAVDQPLSRNYCGSRARCERVLRASLQAAIDALQARHGDDPRTWDVDEARDRIQFAAVGLVGQRPMAWQNRPTFQQVVEFRP